MRNSRGKVDNYTYIILSVLFMVFGVLMLLKIMPADFTSGILANKPEISGVLFIGIGVVLLVIGIKNEIKRARIINADILKILKKITANYLALTTDFVNKSRMFEFIITADKISLDYEMKMLKEFSLEKVTNLVHKLALFYENAEKGIAEIKVLVNENFDTKS